MLFSATVRRLVNSKTIANFVISHAVYVPGLFNRAKGMIRKVVDVTKLPEILSKMDGWDEKKIDLAVKQVNEPTIIPDGVRTKKIPRKVPEEEYEASDEDSTPPRKRGILGEKTGDVDIDIVLDEERSVRKIPRRRRPSQMMEETTPQYLRDHLSKLAEQNQALLASVDQRLATHFETTKISYLNKWWLTDEGQQDYQERYNKLLEENIKAKMAEMVEDIRKVVTDNLQQEYEQKYQEQLNERVSKLNGLLALQSLSSKTPAAPAAPTATPNSSFDLETLFRALVKK